MKAIIFDMDGVLVDTPSVACEATNDLLKNEGIQFSQEQFKKYLSFGIEDRIRIWNKEFNKNLDEKDFFEKFVALQLELLKADMKQSDRKEVLTRLKNQGFLLGLATKAKKFKVDKILDALDLNGIFDSIVTGDVTKEHKPHPEVYVRSLDNLKINKDEVLVIEDSPHGIASAKSAGIRVAAYKTNVFSNDDLKDADFVINNLNEIFALLEKMNT